MRDQAKNSLDIPGVYAELFCVILIGLVVESLVFGLPEKHTIRRWGYAIVRRVRECIGRLAVR